MSELSQEEVSRIMHARCMFPSRSSFFHFRGQRRVLAVVSPRYVLIACQVLPFLLFTVSRMPVFASSVDGVMRTVQLRVQRAFDLLSYKIRFLLSHSCYDFFFFYPSGFSRKQCSPYFECRYE